MFSAPSIRDWVDECTVSLSLSLSLSLCAPHKEFYDSYLPLHSIRVLTRSLHKWTMAQRVRQFVLLTFPSAAWIVKEPFGGTPALPYFYSNLRLFADAVTDACVVYRSGAHHRHVELPVPPHAGPARRGHRSRCVNKWIGNQRLRTVLLVTVGIRGCVHEWCSWCPS